MNHLAAKQRASELAVGGGGMAMGGIGGMSVPQTHKRQLPGRGGGPGARVPRAAAGPGAVLQDARAHLGGGLKLPPAHLSQQQQQQQQQRRAAQPRGSSGRRQRGPRGARQQHLRGGPRVGHPRSAGLLGQPSTAGMAERMEGLGIGVGDGAVALNRPASGPSGRPSSRPSSESGAMRRPGRGRRVGARDAEAKPAGVPEQQFVPSVAFQGPKEGFVFKNGDRGVGYYADPNAAPSAVPSAASVAAAGGGNGGGGMITAEFTQPGKLGIAFVQGSAPLVVESTTKGGAAASMLELHAGLILVAVQHQSVTELTHEQTVRLLQSSDRPLVLGFDRPEPAARQPPQQQRAATPGNSVASGLEGTTELMTAAAGIELDAKPSKMVRCKVWDDEVEAAFRYQSAGWRDTREYLKEHGEVTVWAGTTWPKCLMIKGGNELCYFGKRRECGGSLIPRVKLFSYA